MPPGIETLLKPALWKRMLTEKEILVHASLDDISESMQNGQKEKKYSYYAAMRVGASVELAHRVLTDYHLYAKIIPYIDRADYSPESHTLVLEGGIWSFKLRSMVLFDEPTDRWIHYRIIHGSFKGLTGNIYFQSLGERGTAVYFNGEQTGEKWPPRFVIERGAEIVFGFVAHRMRSYIESQKNNVGKGSGYGKQQEGQPGNSGEEFPQPRSHL